MSKTPDFTENPPYCPNPKCQFHHGFTVRSWVKKGSVQTQKAPGFNIKFKCTHCGKCFSSNTFSLDYRHKKAGLFQTVFECSTQGMSNRSIARNLKVSECCVRGRLKHLSRQALIQWEMKMQTLSIEEQVAYDGFESFVYSQFDPNNINHAVGKKSLFLYDFSYSHLNRKGRMTEDQKETLKKIESKKGRYPSNRVQVGTRSVFGTLESKSSSIPLKLFTDEHKAYSLVLKKHFKAESFTHYTINSQEHRGAKNPLFPINHLDMKLRHFLKSCTRETIAFNKNEMGLMDRYILLGTVKNFLRSKFIKGRVGELKESPAMIVGITDRIYSFAEFFSTRMTSFHVQLREHWKQFYTRQVECSRLACAPYLGL